MMRKLTKLLSIVMSAIMLLSLLVSCKNPTPDNEPGENTTDVVVDSGVETDENGYIKDSHDNVDLGKREIRILCGNSFEKEGSVPGAAEFHVAYDEIEGDLIKSAVYLRNVTVEKRLNCTLKWIDEACDYNKRGPFAARASELAGLNQIDIVGVYSLSSSIMMTQGILADLKKSTTLELDKPWWNESMINGCTVMDKMYFCSGDISYGLLGGSYVFMTNKNLMANRGVNDAIKNTYGYDSIYDLVDDGKWTLDTMMTLADMVDIDTNHNSIKDDGDIFGYVSYAVGTDAFYTGSGMRILETAADGSILISEDLGSQKAETLATKITTFLSTPTAVCPETAGAGARGGLPEGAWNAGQALFFNHFMSYLDISTDADFDMGVIPVPKHDGTQTEYLTTSTFGAALWSVIRSAAGYEDLCTVLDTLASESYRTVTPRYFDTILAGRRDTKEDYDMLYKIREGIVIDGGRVITEPFDEMTFGIWRSAMRGDKNYLTLYNEQNFAEEVIAFNMLMKDMETIFG